MHDLDLVATDDDLRQSVIEWCRAVSPRGDATRYQVEIRYDGQTTRVSSGESNPTRAWNAGCVQDMLLAATAYRLSAEGRLSLDAPIGAFFPELNVGGAPGTRIRVADLLCHAGGLPTPDPASMSAVLGSWDSLCAFLTTQPFRFPPGSVAEPDLIERALLTRLLEQAIGDSPWRYLQDELLAGLGVSFSPAERYPELRLQDFFADVTSLYRLVDRLLDDHRAWIDRAVAQPQPGSAPIFPAGRVSKDFVPSRASLGLWTFGGALWGRNGSATDGFVSVRFDIGGRLLLVGAFRTQLERDLLSNEICHRLGFSVGEGPRSRLVGTLNGFDPQRLVGRYDGGGRGILEIGFDGETLSIRPNSGPGEIRCKVEGDQLTSSFTWPSIWFAPFPHPEDGRDCIAMGQSIAVRI